MINLPVCFSTITWDEVKVNLYQTGLPSPPNQTPVQLSIQYLNIIVLNLRMLIDNKLYCQNFVDSILDVLLTDNVIEDPESIFTKGHIDTFYKQGTFYSLADVTEINNNIEELVGYSLIPMFRELGSNIKIIDSIASVPHKSIEYHKRLGRDTTLQGKSLPKWEKLYNNIVVMRELSNT